MFACVTSTPGAAVFSDKFGEISQNGVGFWTQTQDVGKENFWAVLPFLTNYVILPLVLPNTVGGWLLYIFPGMFGGRSFFLLLRKGGAAMVTFSDLIQVGILVVGIISLFFSGKKEVTARPSQTSGYFL